MSLPYKVLAVLVLVLAAGATGYWQGRGDIQVREVEKVVEKEGKTEVVYRDRIVTVTKIVRPDGTVEETTREEEHEHEETTESRETAADRETEKTPTQSRYSLGISYSPSADSFDWREGKDGVVRDLGLEVGYRLVGPVWGAVGFTPGRREAHILVRLEF